LERDLTEVESAPTPDSFERSIGLSRYLTGTPGIGGRLKLDPDSFRVDEISRYPLPDDQGKFTIARVEAFDIEQNELLRRLTRMLSLRPGSIGIAGTKDRRAVTTQLISIPAAEERLKDISLSGVRILETYRASEPLYLGALYGNRFEIAVHELPQGPEETLSRLKATENGLREKGGFPNYFGPQRFGEVRPVTHLVGRALVLGSAKEAVETYLTAHAEGEMADGSAARAEYASHHDPARALKEFPAYLGFERILLERLARGDEPERALHALPRYLKTLFVHAYQSYLFNKYLTRRMDSDLGLGEPVEGDWLIRLGPDGMPGKMAPVPVGRENVEEARRSMSTGRARLSAPLLGTDTPQSSGAPGALMEEVMSEEGVKRENFHLNFFPELSSAGTFRGILAPMPLAIYARGTPVVDEEKVIFSFSLEKGVYATVLLREFMKSRSGPR
jgi:tRNA pseudouridine13 synthase